MSRHYSHSGARGGRTTMIGIHIMALYIGIIHYVYNYTYHSKNTYHSKMALLFWQCCLLQKIRVSTHVSAQGNSSAWVLTWITSKEHIVRIKDSTDYEDSKKDLSDYEDSNKYSSECSREFKWVFTWISSNKHIVRITKGFKWV